MIKVESDNLVFGVRHKLEEININTFQEVVNVLAKSENSDYFFEVWLDVIEALSLTKGVKELLTEDAFYDIIAKINLKDVPENVINTFEYDNIVYTSKAKDNKINISAFEFSKLERIAKENPEFWIHKALALLFSCQETEYNTIEYKERIFGENMTIDIALPYLDRINKSFLRNFEKMTEMLDASK